MNRQAAATYCRNAGATDFSDLFWVTWTFKSHGWMFTSIRHQLFIHFIQLFISQIPWSSVTLEPLDLDGFKAVSWHEHHVTRTWHAQIKTCDRTSRTYHVRSRNNSLFKDRTVLKYIYICTYKDAWICGTLKPQNNDKTGFFQHFTKKKDDMQTHGSDVFATGEPTKGLWCTHALRQIKGIMESWPIMGEGFGKKNMNHRHES